MNHITSENSPKSENSATKIQKIPKNWNSKNSENSKNPKNSKEIETKDDIHNKKVNALINNTSYSKSELESKNGAEINTLFQELSNSSKLSSPIQKVIPITTLPTANSIFEYAQKNYKDNKSM